MQVLSVSQLNRYVKSVLDSDPLLGEVFVKGEISSLNAHAASGHLYFSLKEGSVSVRAVMFRGNAGYLRFTPANGLSVLVRGVATVYERDGAFQLYVSDMQLDGVGAMYVAFEKLKKLLESEGLFEAERKRALPKIPKGIGVVTSESGAALADIIKVLSRRYPIGRVILYPAYVQGERAVPSLVQGLAALDADERCDLIILSRGGGSMQDLWAFNEELLVRAVSCTKKPVISAVGHETDITLCDFAADVRAPTPSAAAEIAAPDLSELAARIRGMQGQMGQLVARQIRQKRSELERAKMRIAPEHAGELLNPARQRLSLLAQLAAGAYSRVLERKRRELSTLTAAIDAKSPLKTIIRGYTLTTDTGGRLFTSGHMPRAGDILHTRYHWGETRSKVQEIEVYLDERG